MRWTDPYLPPKRPRQQLDWSFIGVQPEHTELKGGDVGEIINQRHESTERRDEVEDGEVGEGFTKRRETSLEFFAEGVDPDVNQLEAMDIVESRDVFSGFFREVAHRVPEAVFGSTTVPERADIVEKVGFGSREGDAVHPSLVVVVVDQDR